MINTLNFIYFFKYHMSHELIANYIQSEMKIKEVNMQKFTTRQALSSYVKDDSINIVLFNHPIISGNTSEINEFNEVISTIRPDENYIKTLIINDDNISIIKKISYSDFDVVISSQDSPQELIGALSNALASRREVPYLSVSVKGKRAILTDNEWGILNLIYHGYSLSEIALRKKRSKSTIATQKYNAMNKLNVKSDRELLVFLNKKNLF